MSTDTTITSLVAAANNGVRQLNYDFNLAINYTADKRKLFNKVESLYAQAIIDSCAYHNKYNAAVGSVPDTDPYAKLVRTFRKQYLALLKG